MKKKKIDKLTLPEFLLADFPIKTGGVQDLQYFIVHKGISLIEIIHLNKIDVILEPNLIKKEYQHGDEKFIFVYHTNNVRFHGYAPEGLLDKAWNWYKEYLIWEDQHFGKVN